MTTTNPTRKANEIKFGIEIECAIPTAYSNVFVRGGYHRGTPVNHEAFSSTWKTQSDGSVRAENGFFPAEIVSEPLNGEAGLIQVVMMLDYLQSIGAKVNASCGLHVHVDSKGVDLTRLVNLFKAYEVAFYDMNGINAQARYGSIYCKPSNRWNGDRYASLNLTHAYSANPHVEIRVWQGAMKPETVVAAIYMAVSLVSRASAPEKVKTSDLNRSKPAQVMAKFIQRFMTTETMIVTGYEPHDIWREMMEAVQVSDRNR